MRQEEIRRKSKDPKINSEGRLLWILLRKENGCSSTVIRREMRRENTPSMGKKELR